MQTLIDVVSSEHALSDLRHPGWPAGSAPKQVLRVPEQSKLALPRSLDGLRPVVGDAVGGDSSVELPNPAQTSLLYKPQFTMPLPPPSAERLDAVGVTTNNKRESPREVLLAGCFDESEGGLSFGLARLLVVENALGFGSTAVAAFDDTWFSEFPDFADQLALESLAARKILVEPEGDALAWRHAAVLLSDDELESAMSQHWRFHYRLTAGLYGVVLHAYPKAQANKLRIMSELRTQPPDALLIATDAVRTPESFLSAFHTARPDGYAATLGATGDGLVDRVVELGWHLRDFTNVGSVERSQEGPQGNNNWKDASKAVVALTREPSFELTSRALASLATNPYPDPQRMLNHLSLLAKIAQSYAAGSLGGRLEDYAHQNHGLDIALFDSNLDARVIKCQKGHELNPTPHVKVDDAVAANECGRIYFAIDSKCRALVVDHVGVHNYQS